MFRQQNRHENNHVDENVSKIDMKEEQIIDGCKLKDSQSQTLLYKQHASILFGMARRYTSCDADAKDVLQDAFLKIFDNIGKYNRKGSIRAWMMRIVINEALRLYQLHNRHQIENYDDYEEEIVDNSVVVSDTLTHEILLGFIHELPDGYRMVFNLCEIDGYSYEEVAKMLNCTTSTCRSQLFKAKNTLRKRVNEFNKKEKFL